MSVSVYERERNRAMRIAYGHARRGDATLAEDWCTIACEFAQPTPQQDTRLSDLLAEHAGPIRGQLIIDGGEIT